MPNIKDRRLAECGLYKGGGGMTSLSGLSSSAFLAATDFSFFKYFLFFSTRVSRIRFQDGFTGEAALCPDSDFPYTFDNNTHMERLEDVKTLKIIHMGIQKNNRVHFPIVNAVNNYCLRGLCPGGAGIKNDVCHCFFLFFT
ncbi:MAG: hypothetical protein KZQ90_04160 [Candidatus Thiodiazotropha sp. (ex Codakia rugifera)]|nr:hypothetical protein [Candidatus Thiodiazotropha sp. (ex Codakia rugifera)]